MVTATESNRTQASATPSFEPQAQGLQPPPEAAVDRPEAERLSLAVRDPFWFVSFVVAGATITSMCGLSTLILAILGLSGVSSMYMLPVASIALGLAFLTLGTVGNAWARIFQFAEHGGSRDRVVFHSGVAATLIAGLAATVLGILNFAFLGDMWFVAVAVIALGLGLLWHSRVMWRVSHFTYYVTYHGVEGSRPSGPFAINALSLAPVRDFLVGLGGTILGILAMMNVASAILECVALLTIEGALTASASTMCSAVLVTVKTICAKG